MRSQSRYVIGIVAILTIFSLYTIISNRPPPNNRVEIAESTTGYDEAEEAKFLEQDDDVRQHDGSESIKRSAPLIYEQPAIESTTTQCNKQEYGLHIKDIIMHSSEMVEKFDFQSCKMSNCFDFSRCNPNIPLKVHIFSSLLKRDNEVFNTSGESNIIHKTILNIIRNSKYYEPNFNNACIYVPEDDTLDRDPLSASFRQYTQDIFQREHMFGMNRLIFNLYSGSWPNYRENDFSGYKIGAALVAKASNSVIYHRKNFDISIPLFSHLHPAFDNMSSSANLSLDMQEKDKPYFLTFKGKRYVIGSGSDTRNSLYHLNNKRDVIMLTTCKHGKKWREANDARCLEEEASYNEHDFVTLMQKSTFCLTPRGRRLGSFRFLEALSYGCIPVVLSDGWVWPFGDIIDWSEASIQYSEDKILLVPDLLRDIDLVRIERMRNNCKRLYRRYFSSIQKIVLTTLSIIESRIKNSYVRDFEQQTNFAIV